MRRTKLARLAVAAGLVTWLGPVLAAQEPDSSVSGRAGGSNGTPTALQTGETTVWNRPGGSGGTVVAVSKEFEPPKPAVPATPPNAPQPTPTATALTPFKPVPRIGGHY